MAFQSSPFLLLVLVFLSIFNLFTSVKADKNTTIHNFVHDTCNRIKYNELYKLCIPVVDSDPREDLKANLTGLLIIFVNHSISDFNQSVLFLEKELDSGKFDRDTKDVLEACMGDFQLAIENLEEALQTLLTKPEGIDVEQLPIFNAGNILRSCVDDFEGYYVPPEWTSRYNASYALLDLAFSMINLITCNRTVACIP